MGHPDHLFWLALDQGEPIGYFESTPSHPRASSIIYDAGTCSICSAFVRPGVRKHGVGAALLARVVEWAGEHGYERCAVDYETHNPNGSRFWEKHFRPVAYSVMRQVDERVAWGHAGRQEQSIW
jgi:GNAT superfamily N-acetyltransferase